MYEPFQEWINKNLPADNDLLYKDALWPQVKMMRDTLPACLAISYQELVGIKNDIKVIGEHHSKSVKLPVVKLEWAGINFTLRDNFYNWKLSVSWLAKDYNLFDIDYKGLLTDGVNEQIHSVYCEGFPEQYVYGPITKSVDSKKFTVGIDSSYALWTFFWLIKRKVRG